MHTYLEFLSEFGQKLIAAGPRFPEAFTHVELGVTDIRHGFIEFQTAGLILAGKPVEGHSAPAPFVPNDAEQQAERELVNRAHGHGAVASGHGAIGDGTFLQLLRTIYALIQQYPELWQVVITLLKG